MKIDFDKEANAVYFKLTNSVIVESEEVAPGIVYDFDGDNTVAGIEILNLSDKTPEQIKQIDFPFTPEDREIFKSFLNLFAAV